MLYLQLITFLLFYSAEEEKLQSKELFFVLIYQTGNLYKGNNIKGNHLPAMATGL